MDEEPEVRHIHNTDELAYFMKPLYIIEDYTVDYDTYNLFMEEILNLVRGSFPIYECRTYPVHFKFTKEDTKTYSLELRKFLVNIILWYPFVEIHDIVDIDESFILPCNQVGIPINEYINYKLIYILNKYQVKPTKRDHIISDVLYNLRKISIDFSLILGLNFSVKTFLDMYQRDDIKEIMESRFDSSMQPHEIETKLQELQDREVDIYKSIPDNPIGVILSSKTGIKTKQFAEFTISIGLKPTIEGITMPVPIENSTLIKGLNKPSYLYIDAVGARKSLVMNKKVMGNAGYFGKIVTLLARTLSMTTRVADCGSKHLVQYTVKSKKHLKKLIGKYYKLSYDDFDYKVVSKDDKDLIGKKIYVRSAVTCCLGDHVCPRCVGRTSINNFDIAEGLSAFESEEVTKVVNQSILSTKHLLTTNSEVIEFNKEFYDFFTINTGEINPVINNNEHISNIEDYAIYIAPEDIRKMEEQDYDSLYNTYIPTGRFYVRNVKDPTKEDILIQCEGEKEIFLSEITLDLMKKGKGLIYFKDIDDDVKLFEMVILNQELTRPLYALMELLNKKRNPDDGENIDTISQEFLDLLIESGIEANVVASELILNRLVRSTKNIYDRPDFSKDELEDYNICAVSYALEHNKSPLIGLSFAYIKRQILSDALYQERNGASFIDPLFYKNVSTDNLIEYRKISRQE